MNAYIYMNYMNACYIQMHIYELYESLYICMNINQPDTNSTEI